MKSSRDKKPAHATTLELVPRFIVVEDNLQQDKLGEDRGRFHVASTRSGGPAIKIMGVYTHDEDAQRRAEELAATSSSLFYVCELHPIIRTKNKVFSTRYINS